jgi:hypothetical protein
MAYSISLRPIDEESVIHTGTGDTFAEAALDLLNMLFATYGGISSEVFEGLAGFQDGEEIDETFEHRDFSMPESAFDLTCKHIVRETPYQREMREWQEAESVPSDPKPADNDRERFGV